MIDTLFSLLTNEEARSADDVEAKLAQDASAGTPWYNEQ